MLDHTLLVLYCSQAKLKRRAGLRRGLEEFIQLTPVPRIKEKQKGRILLTNNVKVSKRAGKDQV